MVEGLDSALLKNACKGENRHKGNGLNVNEIRKYLASKNVVDVGGKYITRDILQKMLCKTIGGHKTMPAEESDRGHTTSRNVQMSAEDYYHNGGGYPGDVCDREEGPRCLQLNSNGGATWRIKKFENGADCNMEKKDRVNCDVQNTSRPPSSRITPRQSTTSSSTYLRSSVLEKLQSTTPPSPVGDVGRIKDLNDEVVISTSLKDLNDEVVISTSRIALGVSELLQKSNVEFLTLVLMQIRDIEKLVDRYNNEKMETVDGTPTPESTP